MSCHLIAVVIWTSLRHTNQARIGLKNANFFRACRQANSAPQAHLAALKRLSDWSAKAAQLQFLFIIYIYIYIYIYYIEKDVLGANTGTDVFCLNSEYVSCLQDCLLLSSEFVVAIKFHSLFIKTEVAYDVSTVAFDFILNYIYLTEQQTVRVLFDSAE